MVKKGFVALSIFIIILLLHTSSTLANWYAGSRRNPIANGIQSYISTPPSALNLIHRGVSGVSSWISSYYADDNGTDWLQTGWHYYYWDSTPKQYVEWCVNCDGNQGTYEMHDNFANQNWGNVIQYWVSRDNYTSRWCAYTDGVVRFCVNNLHNRPVIILAETEIHETSMNPINTLFSNVMYKSPTDNVWRLFDDQTTWFKNFPYDIHIYSDSYFHTYRIVTQEIFLPLIIK